MKTTNFPIREDQIKRLKEHKIKTGIPGSEVVRRGIDLYFESLTAKKEKDEKD
jgi:hypothetical protein